MEYLGLKFPKTYSIFRNCAIGSGVYPLKNICIVVDAPKTIEMRNGVLHKDGAPAIEYRDGLKIYCLNGVTMKPEYILARAEDISPQTVLSEVNVEVRRELLRKIGIERFLSVAKHKILDTMGNYQLLSVELTPEIRDARYLKMLNPSLGNVWHLEGVAPECDTVQTAINWRAGNMSEEWNPSILT